MIILLTGIGVLVGINTKMSQEQSFQHLTLEEGVEAANHILEMPAVIHRMQSVYEPSMTTKVFMPIIEQLTFLAITQMDIPRASYEAVQNLREVDSVFIIINGYDAVSDIETLDIPQITCLHTTDGEWMVSLAASNSNLISGPGLEPLLSMCQKAIERHPSFLFPEETTDA
jgi:hypothetical protein